MVNKKLVKTVHTIHLCNECHFHTYFVISPGTTEIHKCIKLDRVLSKYDMLVGTPIMRIPDDCPLVDGEEINLD